MVSRGRITIHLASAICPRTQVAVEGRGEDVDRLVELSHPWLIVDPPSCPRAATVVLGCRSGRDDALRATTVQLEDGSEPPRRLLLDDRNRTVVVDEPDADWLVLQGLRFVRNALRSAIFDPTVLYLHAACIVIDGVSFVVAGGSRSGKTTTTLAALTIPGSRFVSNDDVTIVRDPSDELVAFGWPRAIQVRADTLDPLRRAGLDLRAHLDALRHPINRWGRAPGRDTARHLRLLPGELTALLGRPTSTRARPAALVFPRFDDMCSGESVLAPLDGARARLALAAHREAVASEFDPFLTTWFPPPGAGGNGPLLERMASLPAFELRQDLTTVESSVRLLRELAASLRSARANPAL